MESKNKTPKYNYEAGDDEKLKRELNSALERELDKSPDEIDTKKVDSIMLLLEQMDNRTTDCGIDKDEFARKYLKKYVDTRKQNKIYMFSSKSMRIASSVLIAMILLGMGNYASVRATNKGIFTNIKDRIDIFYFDVIQHTSTDSVSVENLQSNQQIVDLQVTTYSSWEELIEKNNLDILIPYYIPEDYEAENIYYQKKDTLDMGISRYYYKDSNFVRFTVRVFGGSGKWSSYLDETEDSSFERVINSINVIFSKTDDSIQASFQHEQYIYFVDTNLSQEELEKIITEMRK